MSRRILSGTLGCAPHPSTSPSDGTGRSRARLWCWGVLTLVLLGMVSAQFVREQRVEAQVPAGLIAHWKFDETLGTTAADASGNGHQGTLYGGPTWISGRINNGLSFDGVDDYANVGTSVSQTGEFTATAWIRSSSLPSFNYFTIIGNSSCNGCDNYLLYVYDKKIEGGWGGRSVAGSTILSTQRWYHVALVRTGTPGNWTVRLYLNGREDGAGSISANPYGGVMQTEIGRYPTVGARPFFGIIDDVRIYSRVLSADEMQALFSEAAGDITPPVISGVSAGSVGSSSATISWVTDEAADSQVEYGTTISYGSATALDVSLVTVHSQTLTALTPSTLYHYRVKSADADGNLAISGDFTFTTTAAGTAVPEFDIPPNSPLARGEHPRLLFTAQGLIELQRKAANEGRAEYQTFIDWVDQKLYGLPDPGILGGTIYGYSYVADFMAFACVMGTLPGVTSAHTTTEYCSRAVTMLLGLVDDGFPTDPVETGRRNHYDRDRLSIAAAAYDQLHSQLTPAQRVKVINWMADMGLKLETEYNTAVIENGKLRALFEAPLGLMQPFTAGLAYLGDEQNLRVADAKRSLKTFNAWYAATGQGMDALHWIARAKGGMNAGPGNYSLWEPQQPMKSFFMLSNATGVNYFTKNPNMGPAYFWSNLARFHTYFLAPDAPPNPRAAGGADWTIMKFGETVPGVKVADLAHLQYHQLCGILATFDPASAGLTCWMSRNRTGPRAIYHPMENFLYLRKDVTAVSPGNTLARKEYFDAFGGLVIKSDLENRDATAFAIAASPYYLGEHNYQSGTPRGPNGFALHAFGGPLFFRKNAFFRSVSPDNKLTANRSNLPRVLTGQPPYDGGFAGLMNPPRDVRSFTAGSQWDLGGFRRVHLGQKTDYASIDYTAHYFPFLVSKYTRSIVSVVPPGSTASSYIVLLDRMMKTQTAHTIENNFHSAYEPSVNGVKSTPRPGTSIYTGGDLVKIVNIPPGRIDPYDNRAHPEAHGTAFLRTLLPQNPVTKVVGGPNFEFADDNGDNTPYDADESTLRSNGAFYTGIYSTRIVAPAGSAKVNFLHVLQTADTRNTEQSAAMVPTELLQSLDGELVGAFVARSIVAEQPENLVALFAKDEKIADVSTNPIVYRVNGTGPVHHIIADLKPGSYDIIDRDLSTGQQTAQTATVTDIRTDHAKERGEPSAGVLSFTTTLASSDQMTITLSGQQPTNLAPVPDAGRDQTITPPASAVDTTFRPENMQYLGAFKVPNGSTNQTSFHYGGTAIAYDPTRNGLFMTGHDWYQLSATISIPQLVNSSSVNNLNTAALLQSFADATDGKISDIDPGSEGGKIGGMLVYNGKLITAAYMYYDASGNAVSSHFASGLDLSNSADAQGPFRVGTVNPGAVGGYMAAVPQDMQSLLGGPAVTGQCCIPIISRSSFGAALFAFDPDTLGVQNPGPATALVYYPNNQQPWNWDEAFDPSTNLFNAVTRINGVFMDDTSQSVIFVGSQGLGTVCYKVAPCTNGGGYGVVPGSGGGSSDYVTGLWVYQASDLAKVKDGTLQPWQVRPSAWYQFDLPIPGFVNVGGVAYDPATRRVFISQMGPDRGGGYGSSPVVHVYQLNGTPAATLNGTIADDGLPDPPKRVTVSWSKVSGPGMVTFGNAAVEDTTASFSVEGTYVLRLTGNDSALAASDDIQIAVHASFPPPPPPGPGDLCLEVRSEVRERLKKDQAFSKVTVVIREEGETGGIVLERVYSSDTEGKIVIPEADLSGAQDDGVKRFTIGAKIHAHLRTVLKGRKGFLGKGECPTLPKAPFGDINGDGKIEVSDLVSFIRFYKQVVFDRERGDVDLFEIFSGRPPFWTIVHAIRSLGRVEE